MSIVYGKSNIWLQYIQLSSRANKIAIVPKSRIASLFCGLD